MDDSVGAQPSNSTFSVKDHDVIFWFGDLNYRIEQGPDLPELYNMIENKLYSELCRYDQLTMERMAGNVFHGFMEGSLAFPPTYKYIPNTNNYDKSLEGKLRRPSYCDRILYLLNNEEFLRSSVPLVPPGVLDERLLRIRRRSNQMELYSLEKCGMAAPIAERVRLVDYTDCPNSLSDHKPVRASFVLSVKSINRKSLNELMALWGRSNPRLGVPLSRRLSFSPSHILVNESDSHHSHYLVGAITLTNRSRDFPAKFKFKSITIPPWLEVTPAEGMVAPKRSTALTVTIDFSLLPPPPPPRRRRAPSPPGLRGLGSVPGQISSLSLSSVGLAGLPPAARYCIQREPDMTMLFSGKDPRVNEYDAILTCLLGDGSSLLLPVHILVA
eukprot:gene383-400_t